MKINVVSKNKKDTKKTPNEAKKQQLKVAAVGDLTILDPVSPRTDDGFLKLKSIIQEADIAYGHVEGVITGDEGYPGHDTGLYVKLHPSTPEEIKNLGIDMVSTAGNHTMDFGVGGLLAMANNLDKAGIARAGIGKTLAEARAPAYAASSKGKIALIAATSYFSPWARAGEQRYDYPGRPGINPLRYETRYVVDAQALRDLRRISKMLGFEEEKARKAKFGMFWRQLVPDSEKEFHFMSTDFVGTTYGKFVLGKLPGIETVASEVDTGAIIRSIKDAKELADWVFVALHVHEADKERTNPPQFMRPFARKCIDAGADAVIGTGPHVLRGIEIYRERPIFYSLGNFVEQFESVRTQPADFYERYGLNPENTFGEAWKEFTDNDLRGFANDLEFWQSALASFTLSGNRLVELKLYPVTMGLGKPRYQRGLPVLADEKDSRTIIERLQKLSAPYGTKIDFKDGIGFVEL